jgi:hypothetical protein
MNAASPASRFRSDETQGEQPMKTSASHPRLSTLFVAVLLATSTCTLHATRATADDGVVLQLPTEDAQELTAQLGSGVVGKALPSRPIADPLTYFPLQERSQSFLTTGGKHKGEKESLALAKRPRPATGQQAWRFALSSSLATFVQQTDAGDLVMPSVTDSEHDVIVVTTPANPFVLKGMKPGETRTLSQSVSVNYLDNPSRQEYSGSLTGSYTYVGTYEVTVPAGSFQAILVRLKFEGKVGPATTQDTAYYLLAPNVGVVAMVSQEDVEAFWIIHIDTTVGKVLAAQ